MKKLLATVASAAALLGAAGTASAATVPGYVPVPTTITANALRPGFDSVTLSTIPSNAKVVAGYVAGFWPTYDSIVRAFPHAMHISIAIHADEFTHDGKPVNCLDIEPGDATLAEARAWNLEEIRLGEPHPCDYTSEWQMSTLKSLLHGIPALYWVAAYDGDSGLLGYDAHQWSDTCLGRNLDCDTFSDRFLQLLGLEPTVVVIGGVQHYENYPEAYRTLDGERMRERNTVETWDEHHCENPVKRSVCVSSRAHLVLLLTRAQHVYGRETKAQRDASHLPGRIQGLVHRILGKGVVRRWL